MMRHFSSRLPTGIRRLLRLPPTRQRVLRDVDDEMSFHFTMRIAELRALGMSEQDAEAEATRRFGDPSEFRDYASRRARQTLQWYRPRSWRLLTEQLTTDLRLALRSLRRSPLFTATVILILGLGIGMSTAMFTVFRSVLLRKLPVHDESRIVELAGVARGAATEFPISPTQLHRYRAQSHALSGVAGMAHWRVLPVPTIDGDRTLSLEQTEVTDNFFDVLGTRAVLGRVFHSGDAPQTDWSTPQRSYPVVLSYGTWRGLFGGDSGVLGRHLHIAKPDLDMVVVGVAPPGLDYPRGVKYWLAYTYGSLDVVGRLAPGTTPSSARDEFLGFLDRDPELLSYLGSHALGAQVHTVTETVIGEARPVLLILVAAVALLMLVACTNVGNLMLLRAAGRVREMAIRRAIGASVSNLVRQLLTECGLMALAAGVLGVCLARAFTDGLVRLAPSGLPRLDLIAVAGWPLGIAASATILTIIVFGLVPSLGALRFDLSAPIILRGRSETSSRGFVRFRGVLVASQLGLAIVVLAGAGLLLRSLERLTTLNTGYATEHLALMSVAFRWTQMIADCRPRATTLTHADTVRWERCENDANFNAHDRVMAQLRSTGRVVSVSPMAAPPFLGSNVWMTKIVSERQSEAEAKANPWFGNDVVGPEFFQTLDMPIIRGRGFTDADREGAPLVAVISEGVARRLWPKQNVIGKRFHEPGVRSADSLITIVGLVPDLHFREYRQATPTVFRPYRQLLAQGYFAIKTRGAPELAVAAIRQAVRDAGATFVSAQSMDELIAPQLAAPRFQTLLISIFACAALLLAAIGLYGVTASAVAQQTRELGIRMALGATPGSLRRMVLGRAVTLAAVGGAIGLLVSFAGLRLLQSMLFEISPFDPQTLAAVTLLLLIVALLAAHSPARRATRIDPSQALRAE
jgi:putative ABC transport system permease protein